MKKPFVLIAIMSVVVIFAVANFVFKYAGDAVGKKIGESVVEKAIEKQTGAKVDIDTGSKGDTFKMKTKDGETEYSEAGGVKLPSNLPREFVSVSDAKVVMATSSDTGSAINYFTNTEATALFDKYIKDLESAGWEKSMEVNSSDGMMLSFAKDNETVIITIGANENDEQKAKTTVSVIWSVTPKE